MPISHSVYDVFTPTTQARLNFVPREAINGQLMDALLTPGKQLIVYGESGCGKSTLLLNKLSALARDIVQYSAGLPSVCHQLSLNSCIEKGVFKTQPKKKPAVFETSDLKAAVEHYVRGTSDTLKASFDKALRRHKVRKFDNCRLILTALAKGPLGGMLYSEILGSIRATVPDYPAGNLASYLRPLTQEERGKILKSGSDQRYRFADPLYHTFAKLTLLEPSRTTGIWDSSINRYAAESLLLVLKVPHHSSTVLSSPSGSDTDKNWRFWYDRIELPVLGETQKGETIS